MACVYVLISKVLKKSYVGSSREDSANIRLKSHNAGKVRSTKSGRPWVIVLEEKYDIYAEARKKEIFFKTGAGRQKLKLLLKDFLEASHSG